MTEDLNVFLSYSRTDREQIRRIADALKAIGATVWIDEGEITPGQHITSKIDEGLAKANYFLTCWSAAAAASTWVRTEYSAVFMRWADDKSLLIIPVRLDDTELPSLLRPIYALDFRAGFDAGVAQMRGFFGREGFGPEQPPLMLATSRACTAVLGAMRNNELRLLLKSRVSLNDLREMWMDTFDSRLDDEIANYPLGLAAGEMLLRADQRQLRAQLLGSICANRPDVAKNAQGAKNAQRIKGA